MRLFVAVNLAAQLRRDIWDAAEPLRAAGFPVRWVDADDIHLTLKFLGAADTDTVPRITRTVDDAAAGTRPFDLPIEGFGAFPSVERPHVIWVGCEGVPPLELLQHQLEVGLEPLGFPIEGRAFRPHLTLGRVKKDARPAGLRGLERLLDDLVFQGASQVESVELMESTLSAKGSRYRVVHSVALSQQGS